jgi:hypothetical protein
MSQGVANAQGANNIDSCARSGYNPNVRERSRILSASEATIVSPPNCLSDEMGLETLLSQGTFRRLGSY